MLCPNCGAEMVVQPFPATGRDWLTCAGPEMCGLCAPRDVLEALAARLAGEYARGRSDANAVFREKLTCADAEIKRLRSPAAVMAEADWLMKSVGVFTLTLAKAYEERLAKKWNEP